jgi:hypothetical protein
MKKGCLSMLTPVLRAKPVTDDHSEKEKLPAAVEEAAGSPRGTLTNVLGRCDCECGCF